MRNITRREEGSMIFYCLFHQKLKNVYRSDIMYKNNIEKQ